MGGDVSSVQADQVHFSAELRSSQSTGFIIHELRSPMGATMREFASPSGHVFAVTWRGTAFPDLKQLLGAHFEEFQQAIASQNRNGGHAPLIVRLPGLVVEMGGHMRSFTGRAYLPDRLPSGTRDEDIR